MDLNKDILQIQSILEKDSLKKHCSALKAICHYCLDHGITLCGIENAVEILAYLDDSDMASYQLGMLAYRYLKQDTYLFEEDRLYAETILIFDLCRTLRENLKIKGCISLYTDIELPLVSVLAEMEHYGIRVDRSTLHRMSEELGAQINAITDKIYEYAGESFNLNSPVQMQTILFEKLGLPKGKKTKRPRRSFPPMR